MLEIDEGLEILWDGRSSTNQKFKGIAQIPDLSYSEFSMAFQFYLAGLYYTLRIVYNEYSHFA